MKLIVNGNEEGQILAGIEPWSRKEIEISLEDLSEAERKCLVDHSSGSPRAWPWTVVHGTVEEVIAAIKKKAQADAEYEAKEEETRVRRQGEHREELEKYLARPIEERESDNLGVRYTYYAAPWFPIFSANECRDLALVGACNAREQELKREIAALNEAEQARIAPLVQAARAAHEAKEAAEKAVKEAELQKKMAERLATGIYTVSMERGDRKDWGEPWIAKLISRNGKRPDYDFSEGKYDLATETLSIPCKPGDTVAYGQKNYRKPKRTIHEIRLMTAEGRMVSA